MGATADCELIGPDFFGQPVNTLTTLALVVAGIALLPRPRSRWVGVALIATGIGSFLFHGPMAPGGIWVHDVTLAWLVLVVAAVSRGWERWAHLPGLVALGVLFAVRPETSEWTTGALFVVALGLLLAEDRTRATLLPLGLLVFAAIVGRLGSTGWPLCDPESIVQTHGLWHVGAAFAVAWWALAREARLDRDAVPAAAPSERLR